MPKVDLKLYSTDASDGKKITTSVTYVNPNVSNNVLKTFAQQLNAFTTNTYSSTDRVETVNVDTDDSRKQFRDVIITGATQGETAIISFNITAGEELTPAVFFYSNNAVQLLTTTKQSSADPLVGRYSVTIPNSNGTLFVGLTPRTEFYSEFTYANIA